jgi:hypothetical protein
VQRTAELYQRFIAELDGLNLTITQRGPPALASLSRAVLDALPVSPHVRRADPLPGQVEGRFMSAFYGGRAECRIRRTEVAVSLEDSRPCTRRVRDAWLWDHVIAERMDTVDATHDVQALLDTTTLDRPAV